MPPQPELANRMAQKVLTRITAIAQHGSALARTVRISLAWMPAFGIYLADLERRSLRALQHIEDGKRIVWVGGPNAHEFAMLNASDLATSASPESDRSPRIKEELPSLPGVIDRLEAEMLDGIDTRTLEAEALRMSQELEAHAKQQGYKLSQNDDDDFASTRAHQRVG
jgi:hypothetical protein